MPDTEYYRDTQGRTQSRTTKTKTDVDSAIAAAAAGTTAGKDLGSKGKSGSGMPKQEPGESMASYSRRLREYREKQADPEAAGQRAALRSLRK